MAAVSATETTTANYATMTWADSTDTSVSDIAAAVSTTVDVASESGAASATETAAASAATTTTEVAAAGTMPPMPSMPMRIRARQDEANASTDSVAAAVSTTTATADAAAATTVDAAAVNSSSTTTTSDVAVASATAVSAGVGSAGASCSVLTAGSMLNLAPDFKSAKKDFSRVKEVFVTFVEGLNVISVGVGLNAGIIGGGGGFGARVPAGIGGQVFVFITAVDISGRRLGDSDVLFGPGIVESKLLAKLQVYDPTLIVCHYQSLPRYHNLDFKMFETGFARRLYAYARHHLVCFIRRFLWSSMTDYENNLHQSFCVERKGIFRWRKGDERVSAHESE